MVLKQWLHIYLPIYLCLLAIFLIVVGLRIFVIFKQKKRKQERFSREQKMSSLQIVTNANFSRTKLMNKEEYLLCRCLEERLVQQHQGQHFRLFCQVSMGEFISTTDPNAFGCINSKRVDFLLINKFGDPVIVIEYQGSGHYQNNAVERDAIKKEVCRKADIEYLEFKPDYDQLDLDKVSKILNIEYGKL